MRRMTTLTFIAAIVLLIMALAISSYGEQVLASREKGRYHIVCGDDLEEQSWNRATGLIVLLSISVLVAGTMLWSGESEADERRASILGLEKRAEEQSFVTIAPAPLCWQSVVVGDAGFDSGRAAESLTPLERVIRNS
jgi:hypothetical protein